VRHKRPHKRTLTLNKANKKFLGVCAGVADYLEVEPWTVRLVFVASLVFGGWFLIPLYFIAWFLLDDKPGAGLSSISDSQPFKHFRTVDYRKQLYRNAEDGKFLGVCAGVADYLELNVFAVRLVFIFLVLFTAALPIIMYFAAYFILDEKPRARSSRTEARARRNARRYRHQDIDQFSEEVAQEAYAETAEPEGDRGAGKARFASGQREADDTLFEKGAYSKRREFKYCARKFANLQDRLARMEAYVTSSQFRLHREFKNI
jgi:phage shock protein C